MTKVRIRNPVIEPIEQASGNGAVKVSFTVTRSFPFGPATRAEAQRDAQSWLLACEDALRSVNGDGAGPGTPAPR